MKLGDDEIDETDRRILAELQEDCKVALASLGKKVGLSAPSVMERMRRLEQAGVIRGYHALVDSRRVGLDVAASIGVSVKPRGIDEFETKLEEFPHVLECHHVTGAYTMLLKVKAARTRDLEELISRLRLVDAVERTETLVVLSTRSERTQVPLGVSPDDPPPARRNGGRKSSRAKNAEEPTQ